MSKMIDFGLGLPEGFSKHLNWCFELLTTDIYASPGYIERPLNIFFSDDNYTLVKAKGIERVTYRELGNYELVDAIYSKGDALHSFFLAENVFINKFGIKIKLIALLYEERANIHIWNPAFEELFLPLILDDLANGKDSHWRSLREIQQMRSSDLDVYNIVLKNQVDYEIEETYSPYSPYLSTVVYYTLLKHIFLIEDEKFPTIPGSDRTLKSYKKLFDDHLHNRVDMDKWRQKYHLKNPMV